MYRRLVFKIIFLVFCLFSNRFVFGQLNLNETYNLLSTSKSNSERSKAYNKIFNYYRKLNEDSAKAICNIAIREFANANYIQGVILFEYNLSDIFFNETSLSVSEVYLKPALEKAISIKDSLLIAQGYRLKAMHEGQKGRLELSKQYSFAALCIAKRFNDSFGISASYLHLGVANNFLNARDSSILYYNKAIDFCSAKTNAEQLAYIYTNLGVIYSENNNFEIAYKYTKYSIGLYVGRGKLLALSNLASIKGLTGQEDSAMFYFQMALDYAQENNIVRDKAGIYLEMYGTLTNKKYKVFSYLDSAEKYVAPENTILQIGILNERFLLDSLKGDYKSQVGVLKQLFLLKSKQYEDKQDLIIQLKNQESIIVENTSRMQSLQLQSKNRKIRDLALYAALLVSFGFVFFLIRYSTKIRSLGSLLAEKNKSLENSIGMNKKIYAIIAHDLINDVSGQDLLMEAYFHTQNNQQKNIIVSKIQKAIKSHVESLVTLVTWSKQFTEINLFVDEKINLRDAVAAEIGKKDFAIQEKGIILYNHIPPDTFVYTDRSYLNIVLSNVIGNAVKYSFNGRFVEIQIAKSAESGKLVISISDRGVGIDAEIQKTLFSDFQRSNRGTENEKGIGIGLKLVGDLVKGKGDKIWVESKLNEGSTFFISLNKC